MSMHNRAPDGDATSWAVLVCYGSMTAMAITVNLPPVYLTTFSETFGGAAGLAAEQLGRISAVIFATTVLGILIGGPLADRWGGKPLAMAGLAVTGAGLAMLAAAANYAMLLAAGAVMGFGGGILDMVLSPIVCALQPKNRAKALNWLHAFYCVGALGTVLVASAGLRFGIPWRTVAVGLTPVPAAMFVGFLCLEIPPLVHVEANRTPLHVLLRQPLFVASVIAIALCGATEQGMSQWLPAYAERVLGYGKGVSGFSLAFFAFGMTIGRFLAGHAAKRVSALRMILAGCAGCMAAYAGGLLLPQPALALAACAAVGFAVSCLWPTTLGIAADRFPHGGASMFSLLAAGGNFGCFVMPWVIGVVADHASLRMGLAAAGICPLVLSAIALRLGSDRP